MPPAGVWWCAVDRRRCTQEPRTLGLVSPCRCCTRHTLLHSRTLTPTRTLTAVLLRTSSLLGVCMDHPNPQRASHILHTPPKTPNSNQHPRISRMPLCLVPCPAPPNPNRPQPPAAGPGHWPLARPARATPGPGTGGQCRSRPRRPASPPAGPTRRHAHARTHHARTHARAHARTHVRTHTSRHTST